MATNKDKLLESAQKNLRKKQIPKAIKDYVKIVELDPADVRSRQKLAELYVRTNKNTEAYEQYESIAKYFASNGFHLKAIAIYKQMQRLDPSQVSLFSRLAELNEKQGLIGNAMTEYRNLVDYYGRNGMIADEIKTLEKMRDLDLNNLNVRVKLAEVYANNDRKDDGYSELESVLDILSEKGDFDKIFKLYKMFLPLYPQNNKLQMGLALAFYEKGDYKRGITILENLLNEKPDNADLLRLLGRGYADVEQWPQARNVFQRLLEKDPTDLDIRESLIKCEIDSGRNEEALTELEEWKDTFLKADRLDHLTEYYEALKEKLADNSLVLQTLDSIYELTGEGDKLLDIISEQEEIPEEPVIGEMLSDSLLGSAEEDIIIDSDMVDLAEESDDLAFDIVEDENVDLQLESTFEGNLAEEEPAEKDAVIELDIDDSFDLGADTSNDLEFSFDMGEDSSKEEPVAAVEHNLQADLEEAEFYIQQGLYAEAEKLCKAIMAYQPDCEECQQKLAEIETMLNQEKVASTPEKASVEKLFGDIDFDFGDSESKSDEATEKKVFKTDVDEQIAADDMESHYNLGIAYREMGLLDDAISEFEKAETEPSRYVDCQTLKGLCFSDTGDYASAEKMFKQALESSHLEDIQRLNLGYELGLLYERDGRVSDALTSYQDVYAQDRNYRDIKDKIQELQSTLGIDDPLSSGFDEKKDRVSFL